jgi:hypothetical protein
VVEPETPAIATSRNARLGAWLASAAVLLFFGLQALGIQRGGIHWDEFAMLHLADLTHASGQLESGGRPGLAVALLLPLVAQCVDEIAVIHAARLLWLGITASFLVGVFVWLSELGRGRRGRCWDAAFGVALLALPPAFLDSSLEVRTDQLALAGGAWGGALLLASTRRPWLALLAGASFGIGLLGSQKLLYVAALAGLLALGQLMLARDLQPRREALRALALALGMAGVLVLFRFWAETSFVVPEASPARKPLSASFVASGFSLFEFYRGSIGWREYRSLLPELAPHLLLGLGLLFAHRRALRDGSGETGRLWLAWAALALGAGVALFHAAAFRYFWLTLGLFPAAAFALSRRAIGNAVAPRLRAVAVAGLVCALGLPALLHHARQWSDPQAVQRDSLGFVHRNFAPDVTGFHPESGLFCQAGAQPMPTYFSQHIYQTFETRRREREIRRLIDRFREHEVAFLMQSFRLNQFPVEVRRFWDENYQPYRGSIFVAGRRLAGMRGESVEFELLVPGRYRWLPLDGPQALAIGGQTIAPGGTVELEAGLQQAGFISDGSRGMLLLALNEAPGLAPLEFYAQP